MEDCLKAALKWWDEDVKYTTIGDYGEYNLFDEDPEWVVQARKLVNVSKPSVPGDTEWMCVYRNGKHISLTQADIDILDGSRGRSVRIDKFEDVEVKNLYDIYKSL